MNEITQTTDLIHKVTYFNFLDAFFCDTNTYNKMTNKCKMEHCFMTLRTLSIMNPTFVHIIGTTHNVHVLDSLQKNLGGQRKKPDWVYTSAKNAKVEEIESDPFKDYDKATLNAFAKSIDLEYKELRHLYLYAGEKLVNAIKEFLDITDSQTKVTKPKGGKSAKSPGNQRKKASTNKK